VDPEESSAAGKRKAPGFLGRNGSIYIVIRRSMHAECMYNICLICLFKSHIVFSSILYMLFDCVCRIRFTPEDQSTFSSRDVYLLYKCFLGYHPSLVPHLFWFARLRCFVFYCRPIINYNWRYNKKSVLLEAPVRNQLNSSISI
jgi:hypothetical protein